MNEDSDRRILPFIDRLTEDIRLAHELSLTRTAGILEVAKLDAQMVAYSISDDEIRQLTSHLEKAAANVRSGLQLKLVSSKG